MRRLLEAAPGQRSGYSHHPERGATNPEGHLNELVIARGLPGSGKTTARHEYVAGGDKRHGLSRDDLRQTLYGKRDLSKAEEGAITPIHHSHVENLLRQGYSVFVDDTNLRSKTCREWRELAHRVGVDFRVHDLRDVPVDVCILRVEQRTRQGGHYVPEAWLRDQHARFIAKARENWENEDLSVNPTDYLYRGNPDLPDAVIVDIDGTIALHTFRGPYDTSQYHTDTLNLPVSEVVQALHHDGFRILYTTGRHEDFRDVTQRWLDRYHLPPGPLIMRPGPGRDDRVKLALFREHIAPHYNVRLALDDRNRVVEMWRSIGLTCLQVAEGDF